MQDSVRRIDKKEEVIVAGGYILEEDIERVHRIRDVSCKEVKTVPVHAIHLNVERIDSVHDPLAPCDWVRSTYVPNGTFPRRRYDEVGRDLNRQAAQKKATSNEIGEKIEVRRRASDEASGDAGVRPRAYYQQRVV